MKKILFSAIVITFTLASVLAGSTGAFLSDMEKSTGNTFTAGAIDLKIDNTSYYNGAISSSTSWVLSDLTIQKFFDFLDLKPGDFGEDTISLHVDNNDSYLCANVKLTSNDENGCTGPEALVDKTCDNPGPGQGELAQNMNFIWWADDGDNVYETGEKIISGGPIGAIPVGGSVTVPLADSQNNIWTGSGGPVPGGQTLYIGKAWCFGNISAVPLPQDGLGTTSPRTPGNSTGGIACDGSSLNNSTQTDSLTADVSFTAVQSRHNDSFLCMQTTERPTGKLTVIKVVKNDNGGNNVVTDFQLFADSGSSLTPMTSGISATLPVGTYDVTETGVSGYVASFSGDCDASGSVVLTNGDNKTCTITNDDLPASITLVKKVINDNGGTAGPTQFGLKIDGSLVQNNTSTSTASNVSHTINETGKTGYHFVGPITGTSNYGKSCPTALGGSITLDEGEAITCTITNENN